jgi:hypothetical protein
MDPPLVATSKVLKDRVQIDQQAFFMAAHPQLRSRCFNIPESVKRPVMV